MGRADYERFTGGWVGGWVGLIACCSLALSLSRSLALALPAASETRCPPPNHPTTQPRNHATTHDGSSRLSTAQQPATHSSSHPTHSRQGPQGRRQVRQFKGHPGLSNLEPQAKVGRRLGRADRPRGLRRAQGRGHRRERLRPECARGARTRVRMAMGPVAHGSFTARSVSLYCIELCPGPRRQTLPLVPGAPSLNEA